MGIGVVWAAGAALALGGPDAGELPAPRPLPGAVVVVPAVPTGAYRPSAYEIWQVTAPGMRGVFYPRVVDGPFGPVYLNDGRPFEFSQTRQREIAPVISGTPYR